jgi:glycerol-3-phosphate dehydrogenase (NAD(P)+)
MRGNIRTIKDYITRDMFILSVTKGLEVDTGKRMSEVIADEIPHISPNICVLSGPNLAKEIVRGLPAASVIAGKRKAANKVKVILNSPHLHLEISDDVIGVELGGALKNIIALGAGIVEGLGYGDNAKAAFITHGLEEMVALGRALGAKPVTFFGLTGLGDLIVTCFSPLSRNHYVGLELAKGRSIKEITASMRDVAEGVTTVMAAKKLAQRLSVDMPIVERVYEILFEGLSPHEVVKGILSPHILAQR